MSTVWCLSSNYKLINMIMNQVLFTEIIDIRVVISTYIEILHIG